MKLKQCSLLHHTSPLGKNHRSQTLPNTNSTSSSSSKTIFCCLTRDPVRLLVWSSSKLRGSWKKPYIPTHIPPACSHAMHWSQAKDRPAKPYQNLFIHCLDFLASRLPKPFSLRRTDHLWVTKEACTTQHLVYHAPRDKHRSIFLVVSSFSLSTSIHCNSRDTQQNKRIDKEVRERKRSNNGALQIDSLDDHHWYLVLVLRCWDLR